MTGMIDHGCPNYSHGIVSQNCLAKVFLDLEVRVKLINTGTFVQVHSIQNDDVLFCIVRDDMQVECNEMVCKKADIINVPENLWGPLFTIERVARLPLVMDSKIAESIGNISVGHRVQVLGPDNSVLCIANVTFRNSIGRLGVGIYFGLQVVCSRESLPTVIKQVSLLEPGTKGFPSGCDIVVSVDKLLPFNGNFNKEKFMQSQERENQKQLMKNHFCQEDLGNENFKAFTSCCMKDKFLNDFKKVQNKSIPEISHSLKKMINSDNPLNVGDEVIYLNGDTPERGVVRWLGLIENSLKVGVEFDNPIGSGTGTVEGVGELFHTKYQHSLIVPPMALIKLSDYMMNGLRENSHVEKIHTNCNNNNSVCKSVKTNNNNCINNNNEYITSSDSSFSNQENVEEKLKKLRKISVSHLCSKHVEKSFNSNNSSQAIHKEEEFGRKDSVKNHWGAETQHGWKSLDAGKWERRTISRSNSNAVDKNVIKVESGLCVNGSNPSNVRRFSSPAHDAFDATEARKERTHSHCCAEAQKCVNGEDDCSLYKTAITRPTEKSVMNFHEDKWEGQCSLKSSSDEHLRDYCEAVRLSERERAAAEELGRGSMVELSFKGRPHFGVIRWVGTVSDSKEDTSVLIAGVEMEEENADFTDGTLNNKRYFQCNSKKGLFVPLSKCRKDSRFFEDFQKQNISSRVNYGQIDCPVVEGTIPPINTKGDLEIICGKNRGIQGHHNSCYLDATLFSMFAFTSVFDSLLYRPPTSSDIPQYNEVQRVLREEIVNPLRKNLYVRADRVMKLRTLLEKLSSISGLTSEEKDPEEFLNSLLAQILRAEPFLKLSSGQEAFHYQLFVEKDERLTLPSVQLLFEQSFVTSDIKLKQVPSCLIIQMPRFGKSFKMYSKILPPQLLDITDIIENSPRQCTVCGKLAEYECKDCFGQQGIGNGLESISFCKACLDTAHNHHCRNSHNPRALTVPVEFYELQDHCVIPRLFMELFAVVCIETSHYVAFVKCGSGSDAPWCFFDSMADRKGEQNGYNIPEMVPCPDLPYWLSEEGVKILNEMQDERQLPEHAKRLFSDAYMCMYQSPDLMMYR